MCILGSGVMKPKLQVKEGAVLYVSMKVSITLRSTNLKHKFHLNNIKKFTSYFTENTLRVHYKSNRLRLFTHIIAVVMVIVRNTHTPWKKFESLNIELDGSCLLYDTEGPKNYINFNHRISV
jgi:hypothetical protein